MWWSSPSLFFLEIASRGSGRWSGAARFLIPTQTDFVFQCCVVGLFHLVTQQINSELVQQTRRDAKPSRALNVMLTSLAVLVLYICFHYFTVSWINFVRWDCRYLCGLLEIRGLVGVGVRTSSSTLHTFFWVNTTSCYFHLICLKQLFGNNKHHSSHQTILTLNVSI